MWRSPLDIVVWLIALAVALLAVVALLFVVGCAQAPVRATVNPHETFRRAGNGEYRTRASVAAVPSPAAATLVPICGRPHPVCADSTS
jgi:hypothetical protein